MAARQGSQSNAMLYSLVTFVALFIIATVCAVIFYVKSEEYRTASQNDQATLEEVATRSEQSRLARIVGKPERGVSYLATMNKLFDDLYRMLLGKEAPEDTPATVKFNEISMTAQAKLIEGLGDDIDPASGPDGIAILKTVEDLKQKLESARAELDNFDTISKDLQADLQAALDNNEQEKEAFLTNLNEFQAGYDQVREQFNELQQTMEGACEEQIQLFQDKLVAQEVILKKKQMELQDTAKKLDETSTLLDSALTKLSDIKPKPNIEVQAYKPDAQIVRIDLQNGIVYLDAGIKDHIYRGLTFAIYDRNQPISETGAGKAEIEVFQVSEQVCAARIIKSEKRNPIVKEDIVSNLIWDSKTSNRFVVVGEFDLNNDSRPDKDGNQRIIEMVERWGGTIMDNVTVDTDFIVVGLSPNVLQRPTQDEMDIDPMAQLRFERSLAESQNYKNLLDKANDLSVPVFNQKRFMYLIGYDTLANKNPGM